MGRRKYTSVSQLLVDYPANRMVAVVESDEVLFYIYPDDEDEPRKIASLDPQMTLFELLENLGIKAENP